MRRVLLAASLCFSLILLNAACLSHVNGADYSKVGVKAGDWAEYSFASSYPPTHTIYKSHCAIVNVSGPWITVTDTLYFQNGSTKVGSWFGHIGFGSLKDYLICANLTAHDSITDSIPGYWFINETITMYVAGVSRALNHLSIGWWYSIYWDKATGIMVFRNWYDATIYGAGWENVSLTVTSLWQPDLMLTLLIVGAGVSVVAAVMVVALVKSKRRR